MSSFQAHHAGTPFQMSPTPLENRSVDPRMHQIGLGHRAAGGTARRIGEDDQGDGVVLALGQSCPGNAEEVLPGDVHGFEDAGPGVRVRAVRTGRRCVLPRRLSLSTSPPTGLSGVDDAA